jgi:hypothetical protein
MEIEKCYKAGLLSLHISTKEYMENWLLMIQLH